MCEWQAKDDGSFRVFVPVRPEGDARIMLVHFQCGPGPVENVV